MSSMNTTSLADSKWARRSVKKQSQVPQSNRYPPTNTPKTSTIQQPPPPILDTTTSSFKPTPNPIPAHPPLSKVQKSHIQKQNDLDRFVKLQRRLKWKAAALLYCHSRALELTQQPQSQPQPQTHSHAHPDLPIPESNASSPFHMDASEAETMFRIDFFEFYVLLERALVHLLSVFGILVDPSFAPVTYTTRPAPSLPTTTTPSSSKAGGNGSIPPVLTPATNPTEPKVRIIGDSLSFHGIPHRYHANVLAALDNKECPLYSIFNTTSIPSTTTTTTTTNNAPREKSSKRTIKSYLLFAKDFRNHWKDLSSSLLSTNNPNSASRSRSHLQRVEDDLTMNGEPEIHAAQTEYLTTKYAEILQDLKLEEMVGMFLWAMEQGGKVAETEVERVRLEVESGKGLGEEMEVDVDLVDYAYLKGDDGVGPGREAMMPYEYVPDQMEMDW